MYAIRSYYGKPVVEAADMFDRAQALGRNAEFHAAIERFAHQRDVLQVRQEHPLGLVVRVGNIVAHHWGFSRYLTYACHD